jgi:hypothetical protein
MTAAVNTAQVKDRRPLRFHSTAELLADVERIVAAERAGTLRRTGNWTVGQTLNHLAAWINYGYEGFPFGTPPWFVRLYLKLRRKRFITKGLNAGVRIPGAEAGTWGVEIVSTEEGVRRLRAALDRLANEKPRHESPGFGPMTPEERTALTLRHAELHLSFLHPS